MESNALLAQVDQLDANLEGLEEVLAPLLEGSLSSTTKKLPILDRAKLNITLVYAIESLLFSYLRINGVNAKEHSVYKELLRVQQYFAKIKDAEESVTARPSTTLNKAAAARMIQHSLAGNGSDMTQREKDLKAQLMAKLKSKNQSPAIAFAPSPASIVAESPEVAKVLDSISAEIDMQEREGSEEGEIEEDSVSQPPPIPLDDQNIPKKRKLDQGQSSKLSAEKKAAKKARKKARKAAQSADG